MVERFGDAAELADDLLPELVSLQLAADALNLGAQPQEVQRLVLISNRRLGVDSRDVDVALCQGIFALLLVKGNLLLGLGRMPFDLLCCEAHLGDNLEHRWRRRRTGDWLRRWRCGLFAEKTHDDGGAGSGWEKVFCEKVFVRENRVSEGGKKRADWERAALSAVSWIASSKVL